MLVEKFYILGRIGLYLESIPQLAGTSDLNKEISTIKVQIASLENIVSDDAVQERLESILSIISRDLSQWSRNLRLEHSEEPLRLDAKRLTVCGGCEKWSNTYGPHGERRKLGWISPHRSLGTS